jgi:hypothetical protein
VFGPPEEERKKGYMDVCVYVKEMLATKERV